MVNSNLQTWRHNVLVAGALASELSCPGLSPGEQATLLSQCLSSPGCINGWSSDTCTPSDFLLLNLELFHIPYLTDCKLLTFLPLLYCVSNRRTLVDRLNYNS